MKKTLAKLKNYKCASKIEKTQNFTKVIKYSFLHFTIKLHIMTRISADERNGEILNDDDNETWTCQHSAQSTEVPHPLLTGT